MAQINNILYPVDFTEHHAKVLPLVKEMVEKLGAALHTLHVVEDLSHYSNFFVPHPSLDKMEGDIKAGALKKMDKFVKDHFADSGAVTTDVVSGQPAAEIIKYAQANNVDLIITATHGRKGLEHAIFGSVAENVVRNSPVPVLSINPYK
ncbi:MAG: universal stress protein [Desulfarculaceae bacterium]|nr:universal stress protein [Desulfarculaceae bacterium]MCF8073874.1 universal stress protein [Desulfarculaceae bacterium]MCF8102854.1 universal stress protein [Desulfarculaceae bacterium]MCF8116298.1 universal stress protein [Desulfarculaceae bacterium]